MERVFVCGTRAVMRAGPDDFRVVCASCDGGGGTPYTRAGASQAAVRDSSKPCPCRPSCGAR